MEAFNSAAQTAGKYIFGDKSDQSGTEPLSGEVGKGTVDEPYDSGNKAAEDKPTNRSIATGDAERSLQNGDNHTNKLGDDSKGNPTLASVNHPSSLSAPQDPSTLASDSTTDEPGVGSRSTPNQFSTLKEREGDVSLDHRSESEQPLNDEKKTKANEVLEERDPNDHSGESMKLHDGNKKEETTDTSDAEADRDEESGTGEKWVKSTGLAADGGNFDATQPGAGREADRLLEEKGIHKDGSGMPPPPDNPPGVVKEKHGIAQKLKEKLHIGHGKHA